MMNVYVFGFNDMGPLERPLAGGKGGTLALLQQSGYRIPDGFVILPAAFEGERLLPEAWREARRHLARLRNGNGRMAFAVRSSAQCEDASEASFAGEFETVLGVDADEAILAAIHEVYRSRLAERVRVYSEAQGLTIDHQMAVVVQRLVRATISGVLFTANPVSGSRQEMSGNFVFGLGEALVSGEVEPYAFTLKRPKGQFEGAPELRRYARDLYKLGTRLEAELGGPQDIEWAIGGGKLYLLQSRPITTLVTANRTTGEWNDSLCGDYLWSNANAAEALPDVTTPLTWSIWRLFHEDTMPVTIPGGHPFTGNIGGRSYFNVSLLYSVYALTMKAEDAKRQTSSVLGKLPEGMHIPQLSLERGTLWKLFKQNLPWEWRYRKLVKAIPEFVTTTPKWCRDVENQIRTATGPNDLIRILQEELLPALFEGFWMLRAGMKLFSDRLNPLQRDLERLVGATDCNALLSNLSSSGELASMGPALGLVKVAAGEMSRESYLSSFGHRGPHEAELSFARPVENPSWIDVQMTKLGSEMGHVAGRREEQQQRYEAAWQRLYEAHPRQARSIAARLEAASDAARKREGVRSEVVRIVGVVRAFAVRAGELSGLEDDIFFLEIEEVQNLLAGQNSAIETISVRKETHARYKALPPYPTFIRGRFDPFQWAADPERRSDLYDASGPLKAMERSQLISGFGGAAGRVEGLVRCVGSPEQGDQLLPGEILVTTTTNVGWTPLFLRAAAVVTDVGAPLSHAAIVARELGIPAVVGCGNATTLLHTGDRVRVDGGRGVVEILGTN
jgi:pyruvate,water dikinase